MSMNKISNCCGRGMVEGHFRPTDDDRSEQNPQVPLASEDALGQVPGNAETAAGKMGGAAGGSATCRPPYPKFADCAGCTGADGAARGPYRKLNNEGVRRLICAVVEQAVADYRLLTKRGRIVDGKVVPSKHSKSGWVRETENYAAETLHFFRPGGPMDQWLAAAGIDINPNLIREKLGIV